MAKHNQVGSLGEDLACHFLQKKGYKIIERNFYCKDGELDIVSRKGDRVHFIEVKTVSCEINQSNVIHETHHVSPEYNLHPMKIKRLVKAIRKYLNLNPNVGEWHLDALCVFLDDKHKKVRIRCIKDIV